MTITIVTLTQNYNSGAWEALAGQSVGLPAATASAMITAGTATASSLVLPAGGYSGQGEGERTVDFLNRVPGGVPNPSAAIQGFEGFTTTLHGRAVPDQLVGDKLQG